ncbi:MAG: ABC transporter ATP-binding protein [Gemmatimonadota bacterium]|nr:ABC transporter ATP-binding protein [Gemmatimonadota bacterium]
MSEAVARTVVARPPAQPCPAPPLTALRLHKRYRGGDGSEVRVLEGVDLRVESGEAVAITGASGAGKSTLLHLLGALDLPTSGTVLVDGRPISDLDEQGLARVRNRRVGFVFQFHHLLREFTALENVLIPALIGGASMEQAEERGRRLLGAVQLEHRLTHKPWQLSGGEQQRVAVARALANDPLVLLADEPSGNLDRHASEHLHDLLFELRREKQLAMVIVTHNVQLAQRADRILHLEDGRLHPRARG